MNASTCTFTRWHLYLPAHARAVCVRTQDHQGRCQDRWGAGFDGVPARSLSTADADAHNRAGDVEDAMAETTVDEGTLDAEEFTDVGTQNDIDAWVRELSSVLTHPGHFAHSRVRVRQADRLFGLLDAAMRKGGAVPRVWHVLPWSPGPGAYTTDTADGVSEVLRVHDGASVAECGQALREAAVWWGRLDSVLRDGAPLPEQWRRR